MKEIGITFKTAKLAKKKALQNPPLNILDSIL